MQKSGYVVLGLFFRWLCRYELMMEKISKLIYNIFLLDLRAISMPLFSSYIIYAI